MNRQNDIVEDCIDLGAATEETRGSPVGIGADDKGLHRAQPGLSAE